MSMSNTLENNITFHIEDYIKDICTPLFSATKINYFNYVKLYKDNSHITLSTNVAWLYHFLSHGYHNNIQFEKLGHLEKPEFILWDSFNEDNTIRQVSRDIYGIDHGITCIVPHEDGNEFFYFATNPKNPAINNFYPNNLELLEDFMQFFKNQATRILRVANQQPVIRT